MSSEEPAKLPTVVSQRACRYINIIIRRANSVDIDLLFIAWVKEADITVIFTTARNVVTQQGGNTIYISDPFGTQLQIAGPHQEYLIIECTHVG